MTKPMQPEDDGAARARSSTLVNRNVTIRGRRTSLRLEPAMWDALHEIAHREGLSVHELCTEVDRERQESTLTAAIRVYILAYFRAAATPQGHALAGHGQPRGLPGVRADGKGVQGVSLAAEERDGEESLSPGTAARRG